MYFFFVDRNRITVAFNKCKVRMLKIFFLTKKKRKNISKYGYLKRKYKNKIQTDKMTNQTNSTKIFFIFTKKLTKIFHHAFDQFVIVFVLFFSKKKNLISLLREIFPFQ